MVISEFCHVLVKPAQCCPLLDRICNNDLYCCSSSSCGEDMEASDCEGEDDIVPPSKVTLWTLPFRAATGEILHFSEARPLLVSNL